MIRIAVCDDDPSFAATLSDNLSELCARYADDDLDCRVGPIFTSAKLVLSFLETNTIDMLFLDIDMPEMSGFELAGIIAEKYPKTIILFVSAYDNFVYSSFTYSPFRFLRKLHLKEELPSALEKAIEKCVSETQGLSFNSTSGYITLRPSEILFFENSKNYYNICCDSGVTYKCRGTIKALESVCTDKRFIKVHSAYIVNLEHVAEVDEGARITMRDGTLINIAQPRRREFKEAYMQYVRRRYSR